MRKIVKKEQFSYYCPVELVEWLQAKAASMGISASSLLTIWLTEKKNKEG